MRVLIGSQCSSSRMAAEILLNFAMLKHLHWLPVTARIHFKIALHFTPKLHHICHPSFDPIFLRVPSTLPVLTISVSHTSAPYSAHGVLDRPVQQSRISYHFQLLPAPLFILSRNSLRHICLPQPSPLVELSSMRLWFDDLQLFIHLVVFDFVRA